jgi:hypothetical protein
MRISSGLGRSLSPQPKLPCSMMRYAAAAWLPDSCLPAAPFAANAPLVKLQFADPYQSNSKNRLFSTSTAPNEPQGVQPEPRRAHALDQWRSVGSKQSSRPCEPSYPAIYGLCALHRRKTHPWPRQQQCRGQRSCTHLAHYQDHNSEQYVSPCFVRQSRTEPNSPLITRF